LGALCSLILVVHNVTLNGLALQYLGYWNDTLELPLTLPNFCYRARADGALVEVWREGEACAQSLRSVRLFIKIKNETTLVLRYDNSSITFGKTYLFCSNNTARLVELVKDPEEFSNKTLKLKLLCLGHSRPVNLPGPPGGPLSKCDSVVTDGTAWVYAAGLWCPEPEEVVAIAKAVARGSAPYLEVKEVLRKEPR